MTDIPNFQPEPAHATQLLAELKLELVHITVAIQMLQFQVQDVFAIVQVQLNIQSSLTMLKT